MKKNIRRMMLGLGVCAAWLPLAEANEKPFVVKGKEEIKIDDGYIELPVAEVHRKAILEKLKKIGDKDKSALSREIFAIAVELAEPFLGHGQTLHIQGNRGERPDMYTITYTDTGWTDDSLAGQRYQYVLKVTADRRLLLTDAKAWMKPWAERYQSHLKYYTDNKVEWNPRKSK